MKSLEVEVPIVNHRLEVINELLPAHIARARVIVLYESEDVVEKAAAGQGPLAEFRDSPFKVKKFTPLSREEAHAR